MTKVSEGQKSQCGQCIRYGWTGDGCENEESDHYGHAVRWCHPACAEFRYLYEGQEAGEAVLVEARR